MIIECTTDNNNRTVANVKAILRKGGGELLTSGSLNFIFTRKAIFEFEPSDDIDLEELELELIDYGLEEIEEDVVPQENGEDKKIIRIYGEFKSFGQLNKALEDRKIDIKKATLEYIPNMPIELENEEHLQEIEDLVEKLEEDDDVQKVYTNLA